MRIIEIGIVEEITLIPKNVQLLNVQSEGPQFRRGLSPRRAGGLRRSGGS